MQSLERDVETLRKIPLFADLPTARLKLIAYTAEVVRFEPGEVIVQQGDPADAVYIIAEGEADVWLEDANGQSRRINTMACLRCLGRRPSCARAGGRPPCGPRSASWPSRSRTSCSSTWCARARKSGYR